MLMDIKTLDWSPKMLGEYEIKKEWLPLIIKQSNSLFGKIFH
jgi:glycerol kinase